MESELQREDESSETRIDLDEFGFEEYETRGTAKIQAVLKEHRSVELDFRTAYGLWRDFSDKEYCAGWMSMESFTDLDATILLAYDTYGKKI